MNNNSIKFKNKYLKYKHKYIILKDQIFFTYDTKIKQIGGMGDHICIPNVHGLFESFDQCQASSEVVHRKSIFPRDIPRMNNSINYKDYVTRFLDYLDSKSAQLKDLWMIIGATNNDSSDLSRFKDEYDITITSDVIDMKEPTLLSVYSDDINISTHEKTVDVYKQLGFTNIYELLVDSLKPSDKFSKIIYDWSTTKFILNDDKIFNELASIKKLIALKGQLYIDTFIPDVFILNFLTELDTGYNLQIKTLDQLTNKTTTKVANPYMLNQEETYKIYFGYNSWMRINVLQDSKKIRIYNQKALLQYMESNGFIPKKLINDHISNSEHHKLIEKIDHHNETMNKLFDIFPFPEYTIEYIKNGKYPNNPNKDSKSITQFYLITKKLNAPIPPLKANEFGRILPQKTVPPMNIEHKRQNILLETMSRFEIASSKNFQYHRLAQNNLAEWAIAAPKKTQTSCVVRVLSGDWGDVTYELTKKFGVCFAALNMANAYYPGGGYTDGLVAQEENMFRRTDCHFAIVRETFMHNTRYTKKHTDLLNGVNGRVYLDTENRRVCIRGREEPEGENATLGYRWLDDKEIFPFYELRAAAPDRRPSVHGDPLLPYDHDEMRKRVAAQLETLIEKGVRHVVLSAFGCGAFMNPATEVANAYYEALNIRRGDFDIVVFGIFNAGYGTDNLPPFKTKFANWEVS